MKIKVSFLPDKKSEFKELYNVLPILIAIIFVCISYFVAGKTIFTFVISMMLGVVAVSYLFTHYYSNSRIFVTQEGLDITYGKKNLLFKWNDIKDLKFYKVMNQLQRVVVIEIWQEKKVNRVIIFPYLFSNPFKCYNKLASEIEKYYQKCDFKLCKGNIRNIPPPWIIEIPSDQSSQ